MSKKILALMMAVGLGSPIMAMNDTDDASAVPSVSSNSLVFQKIDAFQEIILDAFPEKKGAVQPSIGLLKTGLQDLLSSPDDKESITFSGKVEVPSKFYQVLEFTLSLDSNQIVVVGKLLDYVMGNINKDLKSSELGSDFHSGKPGISSFE